jgi:hypothetical protein
VGVVQAAVFKIERAVYQCRLREETDISEDGEASVSMTLDRARYSPGVMYLGYERANVQPGSILFYKLAIDCND